jgi:hypothetical protein
LPEQVLSTGENEQEKAGRIELTAMTKQSQKTLIAILNFFMAFIFPFFPEIIL